MTAPPNLTQLLVAWRGGEHSTPEDAQSEAANHNATTGHAAVAKRYIEA